MADKICVIGAGPSGLVACKTLHQRGIAFDCFEMGSGIGGLWRYQNDSGMSAAYASLHINTSRNKTQFSDFPMPPGYPDFPHHSLMLEYFESYTDHFKFRRHITFETQVRQVRPTHDGRYQVAVERRDGQQSSREYRAVVVANGHHWLPRYPDFPGRFLGTELHSHEYREADAMRGKRVLVVGLGNSACDIACEISRVAQRTYLATRRGAHIIPKYLFGRPLDRVASEWMWRRLPFWMFQKLFAAALRISCGRPQKFGLPKPRHRVLEEHPTISSDLLNHIGHGRIQVKPNVRELLGPEVTFEDGSVAEVDVIVYATGYQIAFPFLERQVMDPTGNQVRLYKYVVHPDFNGLYFIGLLQPWGSIMPLAEAQSEWVADLLANRCGLPEQPKMLASIQRDQERVRRRYTKSERHTIQVDYYRYLAELQKVRREPPAKDLVYEEPGPGQNARTAA